MKVGRMVQRSSKEYTEVSFPAATHDLQALSGSGVSIGDEVVLHGYLGERADLSKQLSFVYLSNKELDYRIQIISLAKVGSAHAALRTLQAHSPVAIRGLVKARKPPEDPESDIIRVRDYEIELQEIYSLNCFPKDIIIKRETVLPPEQRHLQIRKEKRIRDALRFRGDAARICREVLSAEGFTEIETPVLFKSTPEGAREFLVPTRRRGLAYALPQSPQQYKQILMASGIPKYYQMARCFRDEDLRADRQPEFTQLDLEMSFVTSASVISLIESLINRLWSSLLSVHDLPSPFPRLTYREAMSLYGSDKPDTRLAMPITDITHLVTPSLRSMLTDISSPTIEALKISILDLSDAHVTRAFMKSCMNSAFGSTAMSNPDGSPGVFVIDPRQPLQGLAAFGFEAADAVTSALSLDEGDLLVLQARPTAPYTGGSTALGNIRLALNKAAVSEGYLPKPTGFNFLWVTDFPLFSPNEATHPGQGGSAGLSSTHHPFTAPKTAADVDRLTSAPLEVIADHYDLVVNGVELGGGSRRIHDARVQEYILSEVLKMSPARVADFAHLLQVLRAGCPPHAGIALGFDRLVAVMLGRDSVRDVIAFPKTGRGEDPLVGSPASITEGQLQTYHLEIQRAEAIGSESL